MIDRRTSALSREIGQLEDLLRQCVQCGLCLPHCGTWLASGDEVQSPRGRLLLMREMARPSGSVVEDVPDAFLRAFDQCIGCRACETACPSGVPFALLKQGQQWATQVPPHSIGLPQPEIPGPVLRRLDRRGFLVALDRIGSAARRFLRFLAGRYWRRRLEGAPAGADRIARLLGSLPCSPRSGADLCRLLDRLCGIAPADRGRMAEPAALAAPDSSATGPRVAFFRGCASEGLLAGTSRRLRELLTVSGCRLAQPGDQDCCGALAAHTGRPGRAAHLRRRNRQAFDPFLDDDTVIVVEAAGCGHELKNFGEDFQSVVTDAVVLLANLELPEMGEVPLKVVYHDPCHARHGQGIVDEPRQLLAAIPGLTMVEASEPEVCCGSGGAWGLRYPEMSRSLGRRKAEDLAATGADLVVTSNPGCLGQIADGLALVAPELLILPLTDLLWYAVCKGPAG
jgi:glycolate oxidase iron-sulfur subunit